MKKTITTLLLTSAFATSLLFAQRVNSQPDPAMLVQRRVNFLTTLLSLTTAQQQQATTIFTNAVTSDTTLRINLKTAHQSLSEAVKNNDIATINQVSAEIGNLASQLISTNAKANAAFYQILTPDQQTKLNQLHSQRRSRFGNDTGPFGFLGGRQYLVGGFDD